MGKVSKFLEEHGYTFKSYFLAFVLFPPACLWIAWKIPHLSWGTRVSLTSMTAVPAVLPPLLIWVAVKFLSSS